ncbi:MAG: hypothetical protein ABSA46_09590 [Thermodesulfovibrionales bacterium]
MAGTPDGGRDLCLAVSVQPAASHIRASDGRDIPFMRAILTVRNICDSEVIGFIPHAALKQEGGTVQDVSGALSYPRSIAPGQSASWDVYELLLPAHPGTASKVHMFGYRAALNWRFDLDAWAEYRSPVSSVMEQTPVLRWALRWSISDPTTGEIELTIEPVKD